jgi:transposase InsO family protein
VTVIIDYFEKNNIRFPRSSIYYYLNSWWLIRERKEIWKRISKKFKKYEPWFLHVDITYWPQIDGVKYYIHIAIDRATRLIYLELHTNKKADTAAKFLESALSFFPFHIRIVLTDNGKEYTLKNHKWNKNSNLKWAFDLICDAYDIDHRTTQPYTPQTNGMVERVNGTVKNATLKAHIYRNRDEMNTDLLSFMCIYILERKHSGLMREIRVKTPFQALEYWHQLCPELFRETPVDFQAKLLTIRANL